MTWKLEDAKARFSELVRRARTEGPQRVTVRGKDAVVVISAEEMERLRPSPAAPDWLSALRMSGLDELDLGERSKDWGSRVDFQLESSDEDETPG